MKNEIKRRKKPPAKPEGLPLGEMVLMAYKLRQLANDAADVGQKAQALAWSLEGQARAITKEIQEQQKK